VRSGILVAGGSGGHVVYPPAPAPCPPWCIGSPDCIGRDPEETRRHAAKETSIPLGAPHVTAFVVACRDDEPDEAAGQPYVYVGGDGLVGTGHDWAESLTPAAAVQLGQALVAAGLEAAGMPLLAVKL
jgi:hypothetical protein